VFLKVFSQGTATLRWTEKPISAHTQN